MSLRLKWKDCSCRSIVDVQDGKILMVWISHGTWAAAWETDTDLSTGSPFHVLRPGGYPAGVLSFHQAITSWL